MTHSLKHNLALCLVFVSLIPLNKTFAAQWDGRILDPVNGTELTFNEFIDVVAQHENIVLGEDHSNTLIQIAQARTIEAAVIAKQPASFVTAWEFLNHTQSARNDELYAQVLNQTLSASDFIKQAVSASERNQTYAPIIETTARLGGQLMSVNLSRAEKAPVLEGGLAALAPELLPPNFMLGTLYYYDRFAKAMRDHVPAEKMFNYFTAQCLVDDVIAHQMSTKLDSVGLRFLVVGGFHTVYGDGVVKRLQLRSPDLRLLNIRFVDASNYTETELKHMIDHPIYGLLAEIVYFVNEPKGSLQK